MTTYPSAVRIVEVGPRDGLQNEAHNVATPDKIELVNRLSGTGLRDIEVTSFVHPQRVPQLADAHSVLAGITPVSDVVYSALVPNIKGLARAIEAGAKRVAVFTAASEAFTQANINMTVSESLLAFAPVIQEALAQGISVRGYVSTAFVCPYSGHIEPNAVLKVTQALLDLGVDEVSLGDTIGAAAPVEIETTLGLILEHVPVNQLALHCHDTYGTALANVLKALEMGLTVFDASVGGLGGCPYAPGASGNLATEDLVYMLERMGIQTGVQLDKLVESALWVETCLGRPLNSRQVAMARCKAPY